MEDNNMVVNGEGQVMDNGNPTTKKKAGFFKTVVDGTLKAINNVRHSRTGRVIVRVIEGAGIVLLAKKSYEKGFKKGVESVEIPEQVVVTGGETTEETPEVEETEEESVEESVEE